MSICVTRKWLHKCDYRGIYIEELLEREKKERKRKKEKKSTCTLVAFEKWELRDYEREEKEISPYFIDFYVVLIF